MVISKKNRYVFIQNQRTASSSTGMELCKHYDGKHILKKHSRYRDFLEIATSEQKEYLVIVGKRNPLDTLVTLYFRSKYSPKIPKQPSKKREMRIITRKEDLSFSDFFLRFFDGRLERPQLNSDLQHADFVLRYESLQEDFSALLKKLGLKQKRPIPWNNPTLKKKREFHLYYPPALRPLIIEQYGQLMSELGYEFPLEWEQSPWEQIKGRLGHLV